MSSKSKLLDSLSTDDQATRGMFKLSKLKISKLPKDYQVNKITNFKVNPMTHKSSSMKNLKSSKSKAIKNQDY